jgi:hypothetical protein
MGLLITPAGITGLGKLLPILSVSLIAAICSQRRDEALNLVAEESTAARITITSIATEEKPEKSLTNLKQLKTLSLPLQDIHVDRLDKSLLLAYERQPQDFEELLSLEGMGPRTVRALSLISELVYGVPVSFRDPVRYSFAHGGKDGHPFPVDRETYDNSIEILSQAVRRAKIENQERREALLRLEKGLGQW